MERFAPSLRIIAIGLISSRMYAIVILVTSYSMPLTVILSPTFIFGSSVLLSLLLRSIPESDTLLNLFRIEIPRFFGLT